MGRAILVGSIGFIISGFFLKSAIQLVLGAIVLWVGGFLYKPVAEELGVPQGSVYDFVSSSISSVTSTVTDLIGISGSATQPPPAPSGFVPFWVKNHMTADMWSKATNDAETKSFGLTSARFCAFRVMRPQSGDRLFVYNPLTRGYFWIDAVAVGPAEEPQHRPADRKPTSGNCSDVLFDA